jgi:hypothetical protein
MLRPLSLPRSWLADAGDLEQCTSLLIGIDDDEPEPFESFLFDPALEESDEAAPMSTDDA